MAKFRDSAIPEVTLSAVAPTPDSDDVVHERSIGDILSELRGLTAEQVETILAHQREKGVRFGAAAVALGLASPDDVLFALAKQFHYPYAGEAQRNLNPELIALNQPFTQQSESFRSIRSQIIMRLNGEGEPRRALAVISPDTKDGKTYFCANIAVTLAQLGGRTLVVDADMRNPRQHEVFGIANTSGLSGVLSGRAESNVIHQVVGAPNLFVMPVGITPPNPSELVERPAFALLLRELMSKFDDVIVDTPAAIYGADASVIAARCGAALVVARSNVSRVGALQELVETIATTPAKLTGVIVNEF